MDRLVRAEGFEPTRLAALEPKSARLPVPPRPPRAAAARPPPGGAAYITLLRPRTTEMGVRQAACRARYDPMQRSTRRRASRRRPCAAMALRRRVAAQPDGFRVIRARDGGYDGAVPGPVLRVKRGEELQVRLVNELAGRHRDPLARRARAERDGRGAAADPEAGRARARASTTASRRPTPGRSGTARRSRAQDARCTALLIVDEAAAGRCRPRRALILAARTALHGERLGTRYSGRRERARPRCA